LCDYYLFGLFLVLLGLSDSLDSSSSIIFVVVSKEVKVIVFVEKLSLLLL
jgi:hypothetical protein